MEPIGVRANRMHAQLWEASINLHRSLVSGEVTAIRLLCLSMKIADHPPDCELLDSQYSADGVQ